jgi:ABC-type protease/lipase transport system fused ATPase/permease subunit
MVLAAVDKVMVLKDGVCIGFGQRDQVLAQLKQSAAQPTALAS